MVYNYYNINNNPYNLRSYPRFGEKPVDAKILNTPIEKVEKVINNTVDSFVKTENMDEEKKKSHKTAIAVGSSVFVLSGLVALLNPKFSGKLLSKMKIAAQKAGTKAEKDKGLKGKIYRGFQKALDNGAQCLQFTNTINNMKDEGFKWLCTSEKKFTGVKNNTIRNGLAKIDSGFRTLLSKPHEKITRAFDAISKRTVHSKYKSANSSIESLENLLKSNTSKLPESANRELEAKLEIIRTTQKYFTKSNVENRLANQEKVMSNLESDFNKKFKQYASDLKNKSGQRTKVLKDNLNFWSEDILMPERNKLEQEGKNVIETLIGDGKGKQGTFNEILNIVSPYLSKDEKMILENNIKSTSKKIFKANKSECIEYFDKKRDLILGSAPTDVLTALFGIGASGILISTADTKEERMSRAATVAFPAIAGLGTSMALTALLFSGVKGMLYGAAASGALSLAGSSIDKHFIPKPTKQQEVMNA